MFRKLALVAVATATAASLAAPADAATALVRTCEVSGNVTFYPPLSLTRWSGTMTFDYSGICLNASSSGSTGVQNINSSQTFTYNGTCLTAEITGANGVTGELVGGVTAVTLQLNGGSPLLGVRSWVLVPTSQFLYPCIFSEGIAVNAGPDVWTP